MRRSVACENECEQNKVSCDKEVRRNYRSQKIFFGPRNCVIIIR